MSRPGVRRLVRSARLARTWLETGWEVLLDGLSNFFRDGALNQAAAIALYALLSIFPLFILSVLAAGWFLGANQDIQGQILGIVKSFHVDLGRDLLAQLGQIEEKSHLLGWIGIVSLIWFSSMIFGAIETALNIAFRAENHRNFFVSKLLAFAMIPLGWVTGLTSVLLTYATTLLSSQVTTAEASVLHLHQITRFVLQYAVPFLVSVLFATIVFEVIPAKRIRLRTALVGSCLFTVMVELVKHAFTWYVAHHTRYQAIFGSLETVVILVIWVFYMALIFLFCAELMSSYERRDMLLIEHMLMERQSRTGRQRLFRKFGRVYPEGAVICREGDAGDQMFFVLSGGVRLEKRAGLTRKVLAELAAGAHFGEMAALNGVPRSATAVAATDCEVAVIDAGVFHRLLRESDDLAILFLKEFSERLRRTNASLDELSQTWVQAVVLLRLLAAWPWPPERQLVSELAEDLGKDPEELRKVLEAMALEGALTLSDGQITGLGEERAWACLMNLAQGGSQPAR